MGQMSEWFRNEMLQLSLNPDTYTRQWNQLELAALLDEPVLESDESYLVEPVGMGYARLFIPATTAYWTVNGLGEVSNAQTHTYAAATGTWGPVIGYALVASATTGGFTKQVAAYSEIPGQPRIISGQQLQLAAGALLIGLYGET